MMAQATAELGARSLFFSVGVALHDIPANAATVLPTWRSSLSPRSVVCLLSLEERELGFRYSLGRRPGVRAQAVNYECRLNRDQVARGGRLSCGLLVDCLQGVCTCLGTEYCRQFAGSQAGRVQVVSRLGRSSRGAVRGRVTRGDRRELVVQLRARPRAVRVGTPQEPGRSGQRRLHRDQRQRLPRPRRRGLRGAVCRPSLDLLLLQPLRSLVG